MNSGGTSWWYQSGTDTCTDRKITIHDQPTINTTLGTILNRYGIVVISKQIRKEIVMEPYMGLRKDQ